ncbi:cytochrome-c oxidase, cbb3-type subunit III [Moraxella equi]|uniref:Cytochrome c oxidase subunit III n=1 Tax=Moraxella equi TaxID=60442 RepID=A0A378QLZ9_9GAMM|nr:cytochrome-c oxidase, cbb3-type subunit III [Moraxella equi]OPH38516.1 cytochrome-c oxidase, cbb3-type subunit III [Moraxella equi]STZ01917.1 Cytochrome c oxidase subunit III [Moraxella equi]
MSFFWSSWITIFSLACWVFIFGVLVWTLKTKPVLEEDETTGHSYDGIREYDKPLPKWWLAVFFGTLAWGLGYFVLYPSIQPNSWKGITTVEVDGQQVPWTSENELNSQLQANNKVFTENFEQNILAAAGATDAVPVLAKLSELQAEQRKNAEPDSDLQAKIDEQVKLLAPYVDKLAGDPEAQKVGNRLFLQNCALCHGSNAKGATGYPDLTDNDWLYGGNADEILLTIHNGRVGAMAAWQKQLGESGVRAAAEYVLSISSGHGAGVDNGELNQSLVAQGKPIFEANCVLCHGADAKGLTAFGAPNLTDDIWLFGGDRETVQTTIRHGRAGVMPKWQTKLGNERIMLLAAYVRSLSQNPVE